MTEYLGQPHYPDEDKYQIIVDDGWTYATTMGDKYVVIVLEDGTLTVREKDAI
jgi:hypothetical protein